MSSSPPQSPAPPAPTRAQTRARKQKEKEAKEKETEEKEEEEKEEEKAKGAKGKGKGRGKGSKEKASKEQASKEKESKEKESKEKESKEKGPKAKGSKAKAAPPAVPTRVQPAREKRNPHYGGGRDTVEGPAPAAASPGIAPNASRADTERDGRMDVDAPRAHSPSYADVVRAPSPSRTTNGGSPSSAGPPGNPPFSARGTTVPSTSGRQVLDHVAVPQPSRGMQDRRAQATSRDRGAGSNDASRTARLSSSESSGTSQSSFETPTSSSSEGEEPSPPEPAKRAASKRSRDTPPPPATAPPAKKARAGPLPRAPVTGATHANAQSKTKRARSPSTQDAAPARKKTKKDIAEGHSKGAGATASQGEAIDGRGKEGKGKGKGKGKDKGEGNDKERPRPKPKAGAKAKEPEGAGTGVGGRAKGGSGKGTDGAGSKASFGEAWLGDGEGYVAPVTPPRPLQLIDFDPEDFIMPTPPPKPGNGKKPALASLNERDTPPPSPTKKQKKQREGTHPPSKTTQRRKTQPSRRSPSRPESPRPSSSRRASPPPIRKTKKVSGRSNQRSAEERAAKDDRRPGAPPPSPPPKKKEDGGDDDDDDDDDGIAPPPSHKAKGKQRAEPEDDEEVGEFDEGALPIHLPGVFNSGDFMADDCPLPDLSSSTALKGSGEPDLDEPGPSTRRLNTAGSSTAQKTDKFNAGPVPSTTTQRLQDAVRRLTDAFTAESIKCKKPAESLWAAAGWTSFDYMRTRRWTRQQVFSRHWSATNPTVDGETKEKRMARMNKAYKRKLARAGSDPTEEQLVELFKDDWDFCADLQEQLIENATARQRQRLVNQTAEQLSRLALGAYLNSGLAMVGYVVDLRGGAKGAVNSSMFGGGPEYAEMLRRYKGNFTAGMNDITTLLRSCDLRLRGLADDTETPPPATAVPQAGEDDSPEQRAWLKEVAADQAAHPPGYFPFRNYFHRLLKNLSDESLRLLYEILRWDLGAMYTFARHRLSSKSNLTTPSQFPAEKLLDIAYKLGFVIANWIDELANNIPEKDYERKPRGRTWAPKLHEMVEKRKKYEREANRRGLEGIEAHRYLLNQGVIVLVPLPRNAVVGPLEQLAGTPLVQSPPITQHKPPRVYGYKRWANSSLYRQDVQNGTDSRIRWQPFWEEVDEEADEDSEEDGEEARKEGKDEDEDEDNAGDDADKGDERDESDADGSGEDKNDEDDGDEVDKGGEDVQGDEESGSEGSNGEDEDEEAQLIRARVEALERIRSARKERRR